MHATCKSEDDESSHKAFKRFRRWRLYDNLGDVKAKAFKAFRVHTAVSDLAKQIIRLDYMNAKKTIFLIPSVDPIGREKYEAFPKDALKDILPYYLPAQLEYKDLHCKNFISYAQKIPSIQDYHRSLSGYYKGIHTNDVGSFV